MRTIWKFPITGSAILAPKDWAPVHVAWQGAHITIWAEVDVDEQHAPLVSKRLVVVGTGHPVPDDPADYLGTVFDPDGLVWHVYEIFQDFR